MECIRSVKAKTISCLREIKDAPWYSARATWEWIEPARLGQEVKALLLSPFRLFHCKVLQWAIF